MAKAQANDARLPIDYRKVRYRNWVSSILTMSQERGSRLDCLLRCLLCLTASLSPRYVDETRFRTSPFPCTHRRCLEKTLISLFARVMEARTPSLLTLLAITWL